MFILGVMCKMNYKKAANLKALNYKCFTTLVLKTLYIPIGLKVSSSPSYCVWCHRIPRALLKSGRRRGLAASLLVDVDDLIAFRARVIGVFEKLDEEGNQTAE